LIHFYKRSVVQLLMMQTVTDFRRILEQETRGLTRLCDLWNSKLETDKKIISEEIEGKIRCVVGQARLVMAERFVQFSGLVDNCEFKQGEKETTTTDLRGFWEMIYFQVEDVNRKFIELKKIEANAWKLEEPGETVCHKPPANNGKKFGSRKRSAGKAAGKAEASAGLKALIAAKRKCRVEVVEAKEETGARDKENLSQPTSEQLQTSPEKTFDGGFFTIKSPFCEEMSSRRVKEPDTRITRSAGSDKLRKSVLTESAKRMSGFVSPFVSQLAKRCLAGGEKTSPVRGGVASVRRASLFDDDED